MVASRARPMTPSSRNTERAAARQPQRRIRFFLGFAVERRSLASFNNSSDSVADGSGLLEHPIGAFHDRAPIRVRYTASSEQAYASVQQRSDPLRSSGSMLEPERVGVLSLQSRFRLSAERQLARARNCRSAKGEWTTPT